MQFLLFIIVCFILRIMIFNIDMSINIEPITKEILVNIMTEYTIVFILSLIFAISFVLILTYRSKNIQVFLCSSFLSISLFSSFIILLANLCLPMIISFLSLSILLGIVFGYPLFLQIKEERK